MRKVWSIFLVLAVLAPFVLADKTGMLEERLKKRVQEVVDRLDGVLGLAVKDIRTGKTFFLNEKEIFPQASCIKIAILFEAFKQAEEGKLDLKEFVEIKESEKVGGSGVLLHLGRPSISLSWRDLCVLMMALSDNTATNLLIARVGMENVNQRMEGLGFVNTKLRRRMMDGQAAREGRENLSTPYETMLLLEKMVSGEILKEPHRSEAIEIFSIYKPSALRKAVPESIQVANKPGEVETVRCDCGIVFLPNSPYLICVMTTYLHDETKGEEAIHSLSAIFFEHFSRLQKSTEYGRRIFD